MHTETHKQEQFRVKNEEHQQAIKAETAKFQAEHAAKPAVVVPAVVPAKPMPTVDETVKGKEDRLARVAAKAEEIVQGQKYIPVYGPLQESINQTVAQLDEAKRLMGELKTALGKKPVPKVVPDVIVSQMDGIKHLSTRILEYHTRLMQLLAS
jgi:hypothetical protein